MAERPDGSRVRFMPMPSLRPRRRGRGRSAPSTCIVDESDRNEAEIGLARLAAIVASSDDAIVSKTLDGVITSWNAGATRIFGYAADEMIGRPISRIIPPELLPEEEGILARLRRGERIEHFDTVRVAKDGRRLSISLTVSPIRDGAGNVVGASKVARDVTERKLSEERQRLLLGELNHRVKNTLATIQAIARQSLRAEPSPSAFVAGFTGRLQALAQAHDLLVRGRDAARRPRRPGARSGGLSAGTTRGCRPTGRRSWSMRAWRCSSPWSCTSSPPMPASTAPCPFPAGASRSAGRARPARNRSCGSTGRSPAFPGSPRRPGWGSGRC